MTGSGRLGFRILPAPAPLGQDLVRRFHGLASANVADSMGRFGFMDGGIRARTGKSLAGAAVTVLARPGDNLMVHRALQMARPGDIVVVATGGNQTSAVFGELMGRSAVAAGLGGLVVDGAVRDVEALSALGLPVFSRAVCPGGCDKDGPGEINVAVSCGGTVVHAGDILVGDADGVAVVPRDHAEDVLRAVEALAARERQRIEEIERGTLFRPDVDELLRRKGVIE